ncbi:hypothetical protein [Companilactobacillus jidongensis]|uniref:hypothetical protein n=1 Tax=Companilactobacillus jidongensis TaxID=2486006 RepID=UPI000F781EA1|nr:hypothetical protein [Companilactobacillus jidongensis]
MNTATIDIIVAIILIIFVNNPLLQFLQKSFGMNFVISEIIIAIIIIVLIYLLNKFVLKRVFANKSK